MSCRSYREELSRCLDGRLQGHARARVMGHLAKCRGCARFWDELKAAQELVLGLPRAKVGPRFRDDVWERIQSGEGAPDAIAQEPVPLATKARYGLLGAAAAAVFILAVHYGMGRSPAIQEPSEVEPIASNTPVEPESSSPPTPTVAYLNPANFAAKTAEQVSVAARNLRNRSKNLTNPSDFRPEVIQAVRQDIEMMQSGVFMLRQLQQRGFGIELRDDEARDCLTRVLTTLEVSPKLERPEQVMRTLHNLTICSLDRLPEKLRFSLDSARRNDSKFLLFLRQMEAERHQILKQIRVFSMPMGPEERLEERLLFQMFPVQPNAMPPQVPSPAPPQEPRKLREHSRR